jgi:sigma-B regulation protein RsbU (phosphoserine phosphatase)
MKKLWLRILPLISPGIRLKLTFFTLFFVSALLVLSFLLSYITQKNELSKSLDNEVKVPLNMVAHNVGELHRIADGLIQIEIFNLRRKQSAEKARKFKKTVLVKEQSIGNRWRNLVKSFGGKVKYTYEAQRFDTYFSSYLTEKNLKEFETLLKSFIDFTLNTTVSAQQFASLRAAAGKVAEIEQRLEAHKKAENQKTEADKKEERRLESLVSERRGRLIDLLRKPFEPLFVSRLEQASFRPGTIRILSYGNEDYKDYRQAPRMLDTALFFRQAGRERRQDEMLFPQDSFRAYREAFFSGQQNAAQSVEFVHRSQPHEARFSPIYVNRPVVERARKILASLSQGNGDLLEKFTAVDLKYIALLKEAADRKSERLKVLREKSIPPYKDPEFMNLAAEYRKLADKRDAEFIAATNYKELEKAHLEATGQRLKEARSARAAAEKEIKSIEAQLKAAAKKTPDKGPGSEELEIALEKQKKNLDDAERSMQELALVETGIGGNSDLELLEALFSLRNAALLARTRLSLVSEQSALDNVLKSAAGRKNRDREYALLRQFVYEARSETEFKVPRGQASPLAGGVLAVSRTEAEDYMHDLDSIAITDQSGLARLLLRENVVGFNVSIINKEEGFERIRKATQTLLIFLSIIAVLAIFAAWYFSGVAVRRIASLSATSELVRDGNLKVEFNAKGYDELATLGQSLNGMVEGLREREEMRGELMAAEEIQKRLLPSEVPKNLKGRAEIAGFYKAMAGVGGDYFDYVGLGSDFVAIAMGDVSNHGVGPALVMAMTRSQLHAALREKEISLKQILLKLNEQLYEETPANIFVTFFLALYNLKTGELQYVSAGHSKPLLMTAAGKATYLEAGGMPLGMDDNDFFATTIELQKVKLAPGDTFLQYTDGLSEAMNPEREQFGYERMQAEFEKLRGKSADAVLTAFAGAVEKFTGTRLDQPGPSALSDDIALVCLKRQGDV